MSWNGLASGPRTTNFQRHNSKFQATISREQSISFNQFHNKMSAFSFSFSGDDIEDTSISDPGSEPGQTANHPAETGTLRRPSSSAFPIAGQPMLEPQGHDLETMLSALPSKIAYSSLVVKLDDGTEIYIPKRELWDVRVQLMAEEDDEGLGNLGKDDLRTGVYEGGFKSWESSVDLVKVLYEKREDDRAESRKFLEVSSYRIYVLSSAHPFQIILMILTSYSWDAGQRFHLWRCSNGSSKTHPTLPPRTRGH